MPVITKINVPKKSPRKRAIYLDGKWAFNLPANLVERRGLVVGLDLAEAEIAALQSAEAQQKAMDKGLDILSRRLHSVAEMRTKLTKAGYTAEQVEATVAELTRLGYLDDARFSRTKAHAAAEYRKHGRRRAYVELIRAGVEKETARRASEEVFEGQDSLKVARELAMKKAPSLRKLDSMTARRRLMGMLLRRGFLFDEIKPVMDEVLGGWEEPEAPSDGRPEGGREEEESTEGEEAPVVVERTNWRAGLLPAHAKRVVKPKSGLRSGLGQRKRVRE